MTRIFRTMIAALMLTLPLSRVAANKAPVTQFDENIWRSIVTGSEKRPVIVHFWGLTCGPCLAELKDWGAFTQAHPDAKIVFVNWDRSGPKADRVADALAQSGLGDVPSYALAGGFEEKLRFSVDPEWMGELPFTRVLSNPGTARSFSGASDFDALARLLEQ